MSTGQMPICRYPQGGIAKSAGGRGIFRDASGEPIRIWVDYMLKSARTIIKAAQGEDESDSDISIASAYHYEPETQLLILNPSSHHIFDSYCHPDWLPARSRKKYDKYREEHGDEEEEWTRKVLLKESWVGKCIEAGRFLGESDDWGGCRVGGPPKWQVVNVPQDSDMITLNDGVKRKASIDENDLDMDMGIELDELEEETEEDIKPAPNLEPADIPVLMEIQVEPPTPSQPLNDARPDDNPPPEEEQQTDLLFEESQPPPPALRRSSRRSPLSTRLVEVKDELESSDEEPLATKPQSSKATGKDETSRPSSSRQGKISSAASPSLEQAEDFDISMLDSGPSSQFQSPAPQPPIVEGKIFSGLVFWVDLSMKNRGDLLKEIKTSGGKIVADHEDATHVLIYKFAQQAAQWKDTITRLAYRGVWFLSPEWAKKSATEKKRLPEMDFVLPGGHLAADALSNDDVAVEVFDADIREAHDLAMQHDWPIEDVAKRLVAKHPKLPFGQWKSVYNLWRSAGNSLPALPKSKSKPKAKTSAFAPLQESVLEVKPEVAKGSPTPNQIRRRLETQELEAIFAEESWRYYKVCSGNMGDFGKFLAGKYKIYTAGSWGVYFGGWLGGRGKWAAAPRTFHGAILSPEELQEGPITKVPTPRRSTVQLPEQSARLPKSEMAKTFCNYFGHAGDRIVINALWGEHMETLYPAYNARTWEKLAREWKDGSDTFAEVGAVWDGTPDPGHEPLPGAEDAPVIPISGPMPYTEDEELAMGQFVLHQESEGQNVTEGSWSIFAEVYPQRTKKGLAGHYRKYKERIMDIVHRHNEDAEANAQDKEDPDATYSDGSPSSVASDSQARPKKQKVAVSKKDYEDLARYIVDNIAEGDVPDRTDFAAFSKDHPERSASSWYTIWHRDKYRSTLLPLIDELRRAATPRSQSSQSRVDRPGSRPHPNAYTDEEEMQMAEFIVRHIPPDRPPKVADWNKFQRSHTKRTAPSWMEHYRVYKPRIDGLVAEIKASNPATGRHPSGTAQDAIELGSEEEEEEEVEEIVPIRPPRSRSRRSDVIIIED